MTKFKFGDKVWHEEYGLCVITGSSPLKAHSIAHNHYARAQIPWFIDEDDLTYATDWISCSERMPELGVPVLVIGGSTAWVDKAYDSDDGVSFYEDNYGRVTHWMPLPDMPEVKE